MSIGYACIAVGLKSAQQRSIIQKNATDEKLTEIIQHNLQCLSNILSYNAQNNIHMFRISSDIIPFGSSPVNTLHWAALFAPQLEALGKQAMANNIRLSMHPGQYTVLNSPNPEVVQRAVDDLVYHCDFLDAMNLPLSHKIILHIGGVYGDKPAAMARFIQNYQTLPLKIKQRLVLENDDRCYTIDEVLQICNTTKAPAVFDNLHHALNPPEKQLPDKDWILLCKKTWSPKDGNQKMHYSQQAAGQKPGSHSPTIQCSAFTAYYQQNAYLNLDIMLEVKDKNLSAIKCILCTSSPSIHHIEQEWARYKYLVLEHSLAHYNTVRQLLKEKANPPILEIFTTIEDALGITPTLGSSVNAAQHVWGYFKSTASIKEAQTFQKTLSAYQEGKKSIAAVKKVLYQLACTHQQNYLLSSYYFL